ncbi:hypothetical protein LRP88_10840 [Fusarium phalaenopsidis]
MRPPHAAQQHSTAWPLEQKMQLEGLMGLLRLAETNPESSVRQIEMTEIMDRGTKADVWYARKVPNFRFLSDEELPKGAIYGMKYKTVVLTPQKFLTWLYERLQARGIKFRRTRVSSLADLKGRGHDILINASGIGAENLKDVMEKNLTSWRLQCVICQNAHNNQPDVFPSPDPKDWPILYDHVDVYATMDRRVCGVRCEKEVVDGQRVIHAYGHNAGGYVHSFGLAREIVTLAEDYLYELPVTGKL